MKPMAPAVTSHVAARSCCHRLTDDSTAVVLWPLIPRALELPSPDQMRHANEALQAEIVVRKTAKEDLRLAKEEAEDSLQQERALMAAIIESSGDVIFAKDLVGRYLLFNPEAARVVGKPADQVLGRDDGMFGISRDITERHRDAAALKQHNEELERFNRAAVGCELDMIDLKQQVNALSSELGRTPQFARDLVAPPPAQEST